MITIDTPYPQYPLWRKAVSWATLPFARMINFAFGVEREPDGYNDYFATQSRKVNPQNLHPFMRHLLVSKGGFDLDKTYLVRMAKPEAAKDGTFSPKERHIFMTEEQVNAAKIYPTQENGRVIGDGTTPVSDSRFDVACLGQLLMPLAPITPWAVNVEEKPARPEDRQKLDDLLSKGTTAKTGLEMKFQDRKLIV